MCITLSKIILKGKKNNLFIFKSSFSYIQFKDSASVLKALNLNGKTIKGREMIVDFEESGPKAGFKYRSEKPSKFNKEYNDMVKKTLSKKRKRTNN